MHGIIRVGNAASHGGRVQTGAPVSNVVGHPVARKGVCRLQGDLDLISVRASFPRPVAPWTLGGNSYGVRQSTADRSQPRCFGQVFLESPYS